MSALLGVNDGERVALLRRIAMRDPLLRGSTDLRTLRQLQMLAYRLYGQRSDLMDGDGFPQARLDASPLME